MALVYVITNSVNGKKYVGKTKQKLQQRWNGHRSAGFLRSNAALHVAMREHGLQAFSIEAVQECDSDDEALVAERQWIERLGTREPNGYNVRPWSGRAGGIGHTQEYRERMRAIALAKGRRPSALAIQRSKDVRAAGLSETAKAHMADGQRRRRAEQPITDAFRDKMRRTKLGKPMAPRDLSEAERARRSASLVSAWAARKEAGWTKPKPLSDEQRVRIATANANNWRTSPKLIAKRAKPVCQECGKEQTPDNTAKSSRRLTGLHRRCKDCDRTYFKEWRKKRQKDP